MTPEQEQMTKDIALRVLAEPNASNLRKSWARDILAWLDFGDLKAATRCGWTAPETEATCTA